MKDIDNYIDETKITLSLLNKYSNKFNNLFELLEINNNLDNNNNGINKFNIYNVKCLDNLNSISNNIANYKIVKNECKNFKKNFKNIKKIYNRTIVKEDFNLGSIGKDISNIPKKIVDPIMNKFGSIGKDISNIPKKIVDPIIKSMNKFGSIIKNILDQIKNIANKTGKIFEKIFKEVFKIMLIVFNFINKELIPLLKLFIKLAWKIIKKMPQIIKIVYGYSVQLAKLLLQTIKNFYKAPISPVLLLFILYFGIQIYLKNLTGLQVSIPHIVIIIFTLILIIHQVCFNFKYMKIINDYIIKCVIKLFNNKDVKNYLKIPSDFGKNKVNDVKTVVLVVSKNAPKFILFIMILLLVIKFIITRIINK
jgi:hypothetical protein